MVLSAAFDAARPVVMAAAFRVILTVSLYAAAPCFAFAILSALLERHWLWIAIPAGLGALVLVAGLAAWLFVGSLLRRAQAAILDA